MNPKNPEVKVGQVWMDWDIRFGRDPKTVRRVKVVEVDPVDFASDKGFAVVLSSHNGGQTWDPRRRKILLRRFKPNSTGYKLVLG
jgi:hypothetical protein